MRRLPASLAIATSILIAGCGGQEASEDNSSSATTDVVVTTTHLADLARNVGGDRVDVTALLGSNVDPHDYEVRPGDIEAVSRAELVARSGGDLDEWLTEAIEGSGTEAQTLNLMDHVRTIEGGEHHDEEEAHAEGETQHAEGEAVDPHWWQDPRNGVRAVDAIRDALIAADPEGRQTYTENAAAYSKRLRELDAAIEECIERVPERQRRLVTTHDSLGYYADRYGIEVIGAVIPSLSTQGQPSAGEIQELVEEIRRQNVNAIFTEAAVNPKVEQAVADEAGATIGTPLWVDSLAPEGEEASTYVGALEANTNALVEGFSGGSVECRMGS